MNFCAVIGVYPKDTPGGAEYQTYHICNELVRRGHDVHYVAHRSDADYIEDDNGVQVHRLNLPSGLRSIWKKIQYLKSINPDILYFRNKKDITLATICSRLLDPPVIYNIAHDYQVDTVFSTKPNSKFTLRGLPNYLGFSYQKFLYRYPNLIFAQSQFQQGKFEQSRGITSYYIGNGHPIPSPPFDKDTPPVVLWLASLKSWKQPLEFVKLAEEYDGPECEFWLVGRASNEELLTEISAKIDQIDNIVYRGECTVEESNEIIERSSLFVNTSKPNMEGFPNTFVQAWLRETPVVSLHCDIDSVLRENRGGTLVSEKDTLSAVVTRYLEDPSYRREVGRKARKLAIDNYSIESVCDRLEAAVEDEHPGLC